MPAKLLSRGFATCLALFGAAVQAGTYFEAGRRFIPGASPIPGDALALGVKGHWPDNCIPVSYSLNTTIDPIPDPNGGPGLPLAEAKLALEAALRSWNDIPTSYMEQRLDRTTSNPGPAGVDFVNEVTFRSAHLGHLPGVNGLSRFFFVPYDFTAADGLDFDGDGDADFATAAKTCRDVDGDGDIEWPAGKVAAGTILDNDIYFFPQTTSYGDLGARPYTPLFYGNRADLEGVAAHEFGHGQGLDHSLIMDTDRDDGSGATMTSYGSTDGWLSARSLHLDDIAGSSYLYPEGSKKSGPAALQKRDRAFDDEYALIRGEVRTADDAPVLGAQPYAVDHRGAIVGNTVSGTFVYSINPVTGEQHGLPRSIAFRDGGYTLPVPRGVYTLGIESADGAPLPTFLQGGVVTFGAIAGQTGFPEEFWSGPFEGARERITGVSWPLIALADRSGIDFVLDDAREILALDAPDPFNAWYSEISVGTIAAVRIPVDRLLELDSGHGISIRSVLFGSTPLIEEESAALKVAMLTTGRRNADGSISLDLNHPLARERDFLVGSWELTPMYLKNGAAIGDLVKHKLARAGLDLFAVAVFPDEEHPLFPGSGIGATSLFYKPPLQAPALGDSYISFDGGASFSNLVVDLYFGVVAGPR
jgi:hypothetical protein